MSAYLLYQNLEESENYELKRTEERIKTDGFPFYWIIAKFTTINDINCTTPRMIRWGYV